ncbi:MAG: DUF1343 domain-containing protein [Clostridium sp.]|nr:DUF1343 domain-containing protein [Clostridium sp.]
MNSRIFLLAALLLCLSACGKPKGTASEAVQAAEEAELTLGAERVGEYLPMLEGKRVALFSNHTGILPDGRHTLDVLIDSGMNVQCVFSPEHGFRGTADAGEQVSSGVDEQTGVSLVSLYGKGHAQAMEEALDSVDAVVVDIQDVGLRYYTYYCTMIELMDACARRGLDFVVLDRPNPNGMYVDGPILDMKYESGVGRLPIPVVHGLTLGEMAQMANGEGWLKSGEKANLKVVPLKGYGHQTRYELPVPPSPNLPNMKSIYLYPSLCYFEATPVSLGRGTDKPFQIYGHPDMKNRDFSFTPRSVPGAKNPPQLDVLCYGVDLSGLDDEEIIGKGINLEYVIDAYRDLGMPENEFFRSFFELLIGDGDIRGMIVDGKSADEIKATWAEDVESFKQQRRKYLLYSE